MLLVITLVVIDHSLLTDGKICEGGGEGGEERTEVASNPLLVLVIGCLAARGRKRGVGIGGGRRAKTGTRITTGTRTTTGSGRMTWLYASSKTWWPIKVPVTVVSL